MARTNEKTTPAEDYFLPGFVFTLPVILGIRQ